MEEFYTVTFLSSQPLRNLQVLVEGFHALAGSSKTILFTIDGVPIHWVENPPEIA